MSGKYLFEHMFTHISHAYFGINVGVNLLNKSY